MPSELRQRSRLRTRGKGRGSRHQPPARAAAARLHLGDQSRLPGIEAPVRKAGESVVELASAETAGRGGSESARKRASGDAGAHLRALIVAGAVDGCRIGELLSLQWSQVDRDEHGQPCGWIVLPTKTRRRTRPAHPRCRACWRADPRDARHGPDGQRHRHDGYVFGNEVGERVERIQNRVGERCRGAGIPDLHFHDLRREFGSRLLDAGLPLTMIQRLPRAHDITTTARYLEADPQLIATAVRCVERGWTRTDSHIIRTSVRCRP